jgi:hypothetical protein
MAQPSAGYEKPEPPSVATTTKATLGETAAEEAAPAAAPAAAAIATAEGSSRSIVAAGCPEAQAAAPSLCLPVSQVVCPASRTFTGCLQHTLTCNSCGHVTSVKEQFNHLSLDLPDVTGRSSSAAVDAGCNGAGPGVASSQPGSGDGSSALLKLLGSGSSNQRQQQQLVPELQALLANFFAQETIEKDCEACGAVGAEHLQQHAVRRLPRVLVVHLKRFQWQVLDGSGAICR